MLVHDSGRLRNHDGAEGGFDTPPVSQDRNIRNARHGAQDALAGSIHDVLHVFLAGSGSPGETSSLCHRRRVSIRHTEYLGWQQSLALLALLVEANVPG
jgi:hypothetical protein